MKEESWGAIILIIVFITLCFAIWVVYREGQYLEEHPCIETYTQTKCFTYDKCVYGIMLPGFCITEEEVTCREETYCIKRK